MSYSVILSAVQESDTLRITLITLLVSSIVAPLVMLVANRLFSHPHDRADYAKNLQDIADAAVGDLKEAREQHRLSDERGEQRYLALKNQYRTELAAMEKRYQANTLALEERYSKLLTEAHTKIDDLEKKVSGPYALNVVFRTRPDIEVVEAKLELRGDTAPLVTKKGAVGDGERPGEK